MSKISKRVLVPYSPTQMYDLVNDVAAYPRFLPWCDHVNVLQREETQVRAEVGVSKGKIKQAFTTQNTMHPGEQIEMQLVDGPFKKLHGLWVFKPVGEGCEVVLNMEFEFARGLLGLGFGKVFSGIANKLVDAFVQRARQLYG